MGQIASIAGSLTRGAACGTNPRLYVALQRDCDPFGAGLSDVERALRLPRYALQPNTARIGGPFANRRATRRHARRGATRSPQGLATVDISECFENGSRGGGL